MADLGEQLWQADNAKTAAIRLVTLKYTVQCESKAKCANRARTCIECNGEPHCQRS